MPAKLEHERLTLGGIVRAKDPVAEFELASAIIGAEDFSKDQHARLWTAIRKAIGKNGPVDLVTVTNELVDANDVADLARMHGEAWVGMNLAWYAESVREASARRDVIRLIHTASNGATLEQLGRAVGQAKARLDMLVAGSTPAAFEGVSLTDVERADVAFFVRSFLRPGVTLLYAPAGTSKTTLMLRIATEMSACTGGDLKTTPRLFGHADLPILRPWRRVLWISAEETGGTLRGVWDRVLSGMNMTPANVRGEIVFMWPFAERGNFTVDQLEATLEAAGEFDAVILDSWTSLVPSVFESRAVEWEADTFATRRLVNILREIAERRKLCIVVIHHSALEGGRGRGNTELNRNAPDAVIALQALPERRLKVTVEKMRGGRDKWSVVLALDHSDDAFRVRPEVQEERKLRDPERDVLVFLRGRGSASVVDLTAGTGRSRSTVQRALESLRKAGDAELSGETSESGSPIWQVPIGAREVPADEVTQ